MTKMNRPPIRNYDEIDSPKVNEAKCSLSKLKRSKGLDSVEDGQESNIEPRKQKKSRGRIKRILK